MTDSVTDNFLAPELKALIERRTSLQQWLASLDEQRGVASERVLQRVREDYEVRLSATNAELSEHVAGIGTELERAVDQAAAAARAHDAAMDALEEARLRHAIGELPDDGWADRERELMSAVQAAKVAEDDSSIAADRLRDLLGTLKQDRPKVVPVETHGGDATVADESGPVPPLEELPVAEPASVLDADSTVESGSAPVPDEGEAFIEQVSVAVEEEVRPEAPGLFDDSEMPSPEKKPPPGLKCPECGYTNDLSAWFCGVCGADVG